MGTEEKLDLYLQLVSGELAQKQKGHPMIGWPSLFREPGLVDSAIELEPK